MPTTGASASSSATTTAAAALAAPPQPRSSSRRPRRCGRASSAAQRPLSLTSGVGAGQCLRCGRRGGGRGAPPARAARPRRRQGAHSVIRLLLRCSPTCCVCAQVVIPDDVDGAEANGDGRAGRRGGRRLRGGARRVADDDDEPTPQVRRDRRGVRARFTDAVQIELRSRRAVSADEVRQSSSA